MEDIRQLLKKHMQGETSPEERKVIARWGTEATENAKLLADITDKNELAVSFELFDSMNEERSWNG